MRVRHHFFTSSIWGKAGGAGFRTVAASEGFTDWEIRRLEELSVFGAPTEIPDEGAVRCPRSLNSYMFGQSHICLSYMAYAGRDFSGRVGNYVAHNVVVSADEYLEEVSGNAFALFELPGLFRLNLDEWQTHTPEEKIEVSGVDEYGGLYWLCDWPGDLIRSLFAAVCLGIAGGPQVFVLPPSEEGREEVFKCLVLLLPPTLRLSFAFSTYRTLRFPKEVGAFGVSTSRELERVVREQRGYVFDLQARKGGSVKTAASGIGAYVDFVLECIRRGAIYEIAELQYHMRVLSVRSVDQFASEVSRLLR